jgi:hypothetical protein
MGQSTQRPEFTPFGSVFAPIGWINGKAVWPILGGNGEGGDGSNGDNGAQGGDGNASGDGTGQSAGDGSGNGSDGEGSGQSAGNADQDKPVTREEFDRLRNQLSAADKNKSAAQTALDAANKKIKEFEDKDRSELEKAQNDLEEANKERDSAREALRTVSIRDAFRDASEGASPPLVWHNTGVAMGQLDQELYELGDDGTVKGMDKAVKELAKNHAYLLKTASSDGGNGGGRTGGSYNNGSGGGSGSGPDRKKLAGKYPALRGRGGNG